MGNDSEAASLTTQAAQIVTGNGRKDAKIFVVHRIKRMKTRRLSGIGISLNAALETFSCSGTGASALKDIL